MPHRFKEQNRMRETLGNNRAVLLLLALVVIAVINPLAGSRPAIAQDGQVAAEPVAGSEPSDSQEEDLSLLTLIVGSGPTGWLFMGVLALFSFFSVTVAIERAVVTRRIRVLPAEFLDEVEALTKDSQARIGRFQDLCSHWDVPVARVLEAGVLRSDRPLPEIEKSMEDATMREMATLRGGIRPLATVGSIAPLIGLLGTVVGMIVAFRTASQAGLGKGEQMAEGIYLALMTTAAGLSIAIPTLLLSAIFNARVDRFFREMDKELAPAIPRLARLGEAAE
ncbi:MAG: hypothetical protein CMJ65_08205 [Planctomycetaceae bacterium]|nr:hypothetical protein [Planctomycetaceae bacterium]